jgi:two-component system chemotaxis response regulator CheB
MAPRRGTDSQNAATSNKSDAVTLSRSPELRTTTEQPPYGKIQESEGRDTQFKVTTRHTATLENEMADEMALRNHSEGRIFVIGGSAGSIEAMRELLTSLPGDFPAPILVVIHTPMDAPGLMAAVLHRNSRMPVLNATDGDRIRPAHVYVAPPNYHLLLEGGRMRLTTGPTENRHRPAIDPLFRSAAREYGPDAVGIILSGYLDDGSIGLYRIKQAGGIAIVQDPDDAMAADMPRNASERVHPDFTAPVREIAPLMVQLANQAIAASSVAKRNSDQSMPSDDPGKPSVFTCPECHGTLWESEEGDTLRFRCRVGHAFTADIMLHDQDLDVERALWAALRVLEENADLSTRLASRAQNKGFHQTERRYMIRAEESGRNARVLRELLTGGDRQEPRPARSLDDVDQQISAD